MSVGLNRNAHIGVISQLLRSLSGIVISLKVRSSHHFPSLLHILFYNKKNYIKKRPLFQMIWQQEKHKKIQGQIHRSLFQKY